MADLDTLVEKIRALPADRIAKVENLVDFVADQATRKGALEKLLSLAPALEAAGCTPPSEAEIMGEIEAVRTAARANRVTRVVN